MRRIHRAQFPHLINAIGDISGKAGDTCTQNQIHFLFGRIGKHFLKSISMPHRCTRFPLIGIDLLECPIRVFIYFLCVILRLILNGRRLVFAQGTDTRICGNTFLPIIPDAGLRFGGIENCFGGPIMLAPPSDHLPDEFSFLFRRKMLFPGFLSCGSGLWL